MAAFVKLSDPQMTVAEKQGLAAQYRITTTRALNLQYHDVLKRVRDGKIFRVTSDGDDMLAPRSATLDMRIVDAEEWSLPNE